MNLLNQICSRFTKIEISGAIVNVWSATLCINYYRLNLWFLNKLYHSLSHRTRFPSSLLYLQALLLLPCPLGFTLLFSQVLHSLVDELLSIKLVTDKFRTRKTTKTKNNKNKNIIKVEYFYCTSCLTLKQSLEVLLFYDFVSLMLLKFLFLRQIQCTIQDFLTLFSFFLVFIFPLL